MSIDEGDGNSKRIGSLPAHEKDSGSLYMLEHSTKESRKDDA
jgi:hypothetical protein